MVGDLSMMDFCSATAKLHLLVISTEEDVRVLRECGVIL